MNHAQQSASTLRDLLGEAHSGLQSSGSNSAQLLSTRVGELQRALRDSDVVSANAEQEIMSLYVLAMLELPRRRRAS